MPGAGVAPRPGVVPGGQGALRALVPEGTPSHGRRPPSEETRFSSRGGRTADGKVRERRRATP